MNFLCSVTKEMIYRFYSLYVRFEKTQALYLHQLSPLLYIFTFLRPFPAIFKPPYNKKLFPHCSNVPHAQRHNLEVRSLAAALFFCQKPVFKPSF